MMHTIDGWALVEPAASRAALVARWSRSAQEDGYWSATEHPLPASALTAWWGNEDVRACLLIDPTGAPVAYGELWCDEEESELARMVVDPARRGTGVGRHLLSALIALARTAGRTRYTIRIAPWGDETLSAYLIMSPDEIDDATEAWILDGPPDDHTLGRRGPLHG